MPSVVSKLLPIVSMVVEPMAGAVQTHQTEWPPVLPAWFGSPASLLASILVPVKVAVLPLMYVAFAKLSLLNVAVLPEKVQFLTVMVPLWLKTAPPKPWPLVALPAPAPPRAELPVKVQLVIVTLPASLKMAPPMPAPPPPALK